MEEMKALQRSTDDIERSSMHITTDSKLLYDRVTKELKGYSTYYRREGPDNDQVATLKKTLQTCVKLDGICDDLGETLGSSEEDFYAVRALAREVGGKALWILESDWSKRSLSAAELKDFPKLPEVWRWPH